MITIIVGNNEVRVNEEMFHSFQIREAMIELLKVIIADARYRTKEKIIIRRDDKDIPVEIFI